MGDEEEKGKGGERYAEAGYEDFGLLGGGGHRGTVVAESGIY